MRDELVRLRREIHRHAELPFLEVATAALILRELEGLPVQIRTGAAAMTIDGVVDYPSVEQRAEAAAAAVAAGFDETTLTALAENGTAVVVDIPGARPGPTWALRFDIDGLPIVESTSPVHLPARAGFASQTGAMHACGHDGHTAIGLQLARQLVDGDFPGHVRMLFQPAEEGSRGAAAMIPAGVLDGVDRFLALHLGHSLPAGLAVGTGVGVQATTKFRVTFTGIEAHAAGAPQEGRNAVAAAATAILHILALPRSSKAATNANVGTIAGGSATNIVPSSCVITGEVRSDDGATCEDLLERVRGVIDGAARTWGVESELVVTASATTLHPDDVLVDEVVAVARRLFGDAGVRRTATMSASDDATILAREVQRAGGLATYVMVGGANEHPHHHPLFDIDEDCLVPAVRWLEEVIRSADDHSLHD
ncbi:amidohydrolase [Pseudactinotalea terrae]|uniref:amidohydrolase n=1 Tax=Pseudactinotalea terrae TaxID=1743262 RepID=UPI0012E2C941|nr:amidohydrolase [Pseudactinotalea terrae]